MILTLHIFYKIPNKSTSQSNFITNREKLHEGVLKDVERQQRRKIENMYVLQQQAELTKQLREIEKQSAALDTQNQ